MTTATLDLNDIQVDVVFKDIKNIHLSVYPPTGRVRISAPVRMNLDTIRSFAISKLDWIKLRQAKLQRQERETPREYLERESHYLWGERYLLQVLEREAAPEVQLEPRRMILQVRPPASVDKMKAVVAQFYRAEIKAAALLLIEKWQPVMGVTVDRVYVQQMRTMWGSCNPTARAIRLNTELAKKPKYCLEYIVIHEMAHLLVPTHNARFTALMDRCLPNWRNYRDDLNAHSLSYQNWD